MSLGMSVISGGMQVFQALGSYAAAKQKAASDRAWQEYNNKMVRINDALNQNTLTTNQRMRETRTTMQKLQLQRSEAATSAKVEVSAAATGTVGRSVNASLMAVRRNASAARSELERDGIYQDMQIDNQRMLSTFQADSSIDMRTIPEPSLASTVLGLTQTALENRETIMSVWNGAKSKL